MNKDYLNEQKKFIVDLLLFNLFYALKGNFRN